MNINYYICSEISTNSDITLITAYVFALLSLILSLGILQLKVDLGLWKVACRVFSTITIFLANNICQVMQFVMVSKGYSCHEYKWQGTTSISIAKTNGSGQFCYPSLSVIGSYQQICLSARLSLSGLPYYSSAEIT